MSVDSAWQHTVGRDDVVIAVLDSGILWDYKDLVRKLYLNPGELPAPGGRKRPRTGTATASSTSTTTRETLASATATATASSIRAI